MRQTQNFTDRKSMEKEHSVPSLSALLSTSRTLFSRKASDSQGLNSEFPLLRLSEMKTAPQTPELLGVSSLLRELPVLNQKSRGIKK